MDLNILPTLADTATGGGFDIMGLLPLVLVFVVMYFLLIRPQQKKSQELKRMQQSLQRGDRVLMNGGLFGEVAKVLGPDEISLEIADGVKVKVSPSMIGSVLSGTKAPSHSGSIDDTELDTPRRRERTIGIESTRSTPAAKKTSKASKTSSKTASKASKSSTKKASTSKKKTVAKKTTAKDAKKKAKVA